MATIAEGDVLDVFEQSTDPNEPLTATEVSEVVGCARRTAYNELTALSDRGMLRTKPVGAGGRVWWRPRGPRRGGARDQLREFEFYSDSIATPLMDGADDVTVTIDSAIALDDGTTVQYNTATGITPKAFIDSLEALPSVLDVRLLSTVDGTVRAAVHATNDTMASVFAEHGGRLKSVSVSDGIFSISAELPGDADAEAVMSAVAEIYPDLVLVSERTVYTPRLFRHQVEAELTERQRQALRSAYYAGYFDETRRSTGDDIAETLGVTRQTFHHHLRLAENAVFERFFARAGGKRSASDQ